jgi:hypothetical protein
MVNFIQKEIVLAPIVEITSPRSSSVTVESSTYTVQGVVKNISQENELQIRVNGQMITNYSFVKSAGQIAFSVPLNFDNFRTKFTVEVLASNVAGSSQDECTLSKKMISPVLPNTGAVKPPVIIGNPSVPDTRKDTDDAPRTNSSPTKPTIGTRSTTTITRPTGMR